MKLDRTRPYGEIFGGTGGAKYEQDNKLFTADGDPVGNKAQAEPEVEVVPAAEVAADLAAAAAPARRAGNKKRPV